MKTPRIDDFDPNAKERKLNSSMDNFPAIEKPPHFPIPSQPAINQNQETSTPVPGYAGTTIRRKIKRRHPFDIYQDQYDELRRLSVSQVVQGGIGNMSAMVRDALDTYLAKKRKQ